MPQQVKIRAVPVTGNPALDGFLSDVHQLLSQTSSAVPSPQPITNLKVTPLAGSILIQFTRSNAQNFRLYMGSSPDRTQASIVDLGVNNQYTDSLGKGGVQRWYWVQAITPNSLSPSSTSGPVTATSLALGTNATVVQQQPVTQSYMLIFDATIHAYRPAVPGVDYVTAGKQAVNEQ